METPNYNKNRIPYIPICKLYGYYIHLMRFMSYCHCILIVGGIGYPANASQEDEQNKLPITKFRGLQ